MPKCSRKGKSGPRRSRSHKTKNRTKDIDQIQDELKKESIEGEKPPVFDEDLPGQGMYPCKFCSKHFIDEYTLNMHKRGKGHKRRIKELNEDPYSQEEAERAAGMGCYKRIKL